MNPRTTPTVVAVAWLCSLALVFALGILAGGAVLGGSSDRAGAGSGSVQDDYAGLVERLAGQPYEPDQRRLGEAEQAALHHVVTLPMTADNLDMIEDLAQGMPQGHLAEAVRFLNSLESSAARGEVLRIFLKAWGQADGRSALAFVISDSLTADPFTAELAVLNGWAATNAEAAFERFENASGSLSHRSERIEVIVDAIARTDPDAAVDLVRAIEEPILRDFALGELAETVLSAEGGRQSMAWLAALPPFADRDVLTARAAYAWARQKPLEAATWAGSVRDEALMNAALPSIVEGWATRDPRTAAQWSAGIGPGELRSRCLTLAAEVWLEHTSPAELAQWLNEVDKHEDFDGAINALAMGSMRQAPGAAFTWALSIEDTEVRDHALLLVGREWLEQQPDAAYDYIAAAALNRNVENLLIGEPVEYAASEAEATLQLTPGERIVLTGPAQSPEPASETTNEGDAGESDVAAEESLSLESQ